MSRFLKYPVRCTVLLILSWLIIGCDGNSKAFINTVEANRLNVQRIELTVDNPQSIIEVGQTLTFSVNAIDKDAKTIPLSSKKIEWSVNCESGTEGCAIIDDEGRFIGISDGKATVTARYSSFEATETITVSSATLESITVEQVGDTSLPIDFCRSIKLKATGVYDDGTERDITNLVNPWKAEGGEGQVFKDDAGSVFFSTSTADPTTIKATHNSETGSEVFEAKGSLPDISIEPASISVYTGQTRQFTANGSWSGVSEQITQNVAWSSQNTDILTFSNKTTGFVLSSREDGLATGVSPGAATIVAACDTQQETKLINVKTVEVIGIRIVKDGDAQSNDPYTIKVGSTVSFKAYPVYSDGETPENTDDVTIHCSWNISGGQGDTVEVGDSTNDDAVTMSKRGNITGLLATRDSPGFTDITVKYDVINGSKYSQSTTFQVMVEQ